MIFTWAFRVGMLLSLYNLIRFIVEYAKKSNTDQIKIPQSLGKTVKRQCLRWLPFIHGSDNCYK